MITDPPVGLLELGMPTAAPSPQGRPRPRQRPRRKDTEADIATRLFTQRLILGHGELPGEGIIPYSAMPSRIRKEIPLDSPPVGWDPSTLQPEEMFLLRRLMALGEQERGAFTKK